MRLTCASCPESYDAALPRWRCECGSWLRLEGTRLFRRESLPGRPPSLWRYSEALGIDDPGQAVTLGEGMTPLVSLELDRSEVLAKLDFLCPTGSFKDRGSAVMISKLREWGVGEIVEDSSGNAGA